MSKIVKLRLVVDVEYDIPDTWEGDSGIGAAKVMLEDLPAIAAGEGLFTKSTDIEVEEWSARVEQIAVPDKGAHGCGFYVRGNLEIVDARPENLDPDSLDHEPPDTWFADRSSAERAVRVIRAHLDGADLLRDTDTPAP